MYTSSKVVPVNKKRDQRGKKTLRPKKVRTSVGRNSPTCCRSSPLPLFPFASSLLPSPPFLNSSPPYTPYSCHNEVSRKALQLIQSIISVFSCLLLDIGLLRASPSAVTVGTALIPSALLVAGVYAVKPEFVAYAVALAGVITSVALFAGGSSMSHRVPPD